MTDAELDRLQVLADAATAGPWGTIPPGGPNGAFWGICNRLGMIVAMRLTTSKADAEFIAASRDAVPALIAEVRRLRTDTEWTTAVQKAEQERYLLWLNRVKTIRAIASARLAASPSTDEAAVLWQIVGKTEGE